MEKVLRLYKYIDGINDIAFPNEKEQAIITSFRYDAKRMGAAPTISFSLMHSLCLDSLWDNKVYALFNGERFYVKQTPTSSYSSSDTRYKHEVEIVSERFILDNIYFYDAVSSSSQDKPVSNNSKFSFFGNIEEYVSRLNNSLNKSNVGYSIVIDDDILSDETLKSIESQVTFEDQVITNALQEIYNVYKIPYYFVGKTIHVGYYQDNIDTVFKYGCKNSLISISKTNANSKVINKITGVGSSDNIPYYYPNVDEKGITQVLYNGREGIAEITDLVKYRKVKLADKFVFHETIQSLVPLIDEDDYSFGDFRDEGIDGDGKQRVSIDFYYSFTLQQYESVEFSVTTTYEDSLDLRYEIFNPSGQYVAYYKEDKTMQLTGGNYQFVIRWSFLSKEPMIGSDDVIKNFVSQYLKVKANIVVDSSNAWTKNNIPVTLSDYGISVNSPSDGDVLTIERLAYIQPQPNLVPPIYRDTEGGERFYEAINGKYKNEKGGYYQFDNEYTPTNPREHIENFDDIKPTIKNVINGSGYYIDEFIDFAYDLDDNDETDESGKFIHPYFFGKLRRFDGEFGFNLFDHAIDEGEMVVSMTSGTCGSCEFVIGVDEQSQKNKVQVDSDGNLVRDNNGNVRLSTPQDRQNDTKNNEVWIALKKDIQTFGVVMPNAGNNYRPKAKDKFVLLHIDLPQKYVEAAENVLKDKLIKYMHENNFEKFNFSIAFSRIYFAENPTILANLSENSKIQIEYNNNIYDLYISSLSYSISNDSALPEVKVELEDALSISQNQITQVVESTKREIISSIDKNVFWGDIKGVPTWITSDKPRYSYSELSGRGTSDNSNDVWVVKKDAKGNSYVYTKLDVVVERGVTMYGTDESVDVPSIFDGLRIDNDTIYWEEIKDEEGNVITRVLKSRGVGEGGVTPTLLGDLKNVGSWANVIATEDRIMVQKKDSSSWEALELSKIGGSASFENVKESGDGNAFTSFTLSKDKKTLTFVKDKTFAEKATTLLGYGITDAYTKTESDNLLAKKWTQDDNKITNWDTAFGWGDHSKAGYAKSVDVISELKKYVTLSGTQTVIGEKNFTGGLKVNGSPIVYNATGKYWKLEGDLLVTGGITMFGNDSSFSPSTITQGVNVDGVTIINDGKKLMLNPNLELGGGVTDYNDLDNLPDLTIYATKGTTLAHYGITDACTDDGIKALLKGYLPLNGSTAMTGTLQSQTIRPKTSNSYSLGTSSYLWSNVYTKLATIDGIEIKKSASGVLFIDGNLVVSGGITMYGTDGTSAPSIWDGAPKATTTNNENGKGIASFDSKYFSVTNGHVTFIGSTGGGGGKNLNITLPDGSTKVEYNGDAEKSIVLTRLYKSTEVTTSTTDEGTITPLAMNTWTTGKFPLKNGTGATGEWNISIKGNAATATKATQDRNGNNIASTYLPKSVASTTYLGINAKAASATSADSATNATNASKVYLTGSSSNSTYRLVFADGASGSNRSLYVDNENTATAGYNPSTNTFVGNGVTLSNGVYASIKTKGWYRFATTINAENEAGGSLIFSIRRQYNNYKTESHIIAVSVGYSSVTFTQIAGAPSDALITKVRATNNTNGVIYFDFYYGVDTTNTHKVYVNCIGSASLQTPTSTTQLLSYVTEFDLVNGFKSNVIHFTSLNNLGYLRSKCGKNLLVGGDNLSGGTAYAFARYSYSEAVQVNRTYRLTICGKLGENTSHIYAYWDGGSGNNTYIGGLSKTEERIITVRAKITNKGTNKQLVFYKFNSSNTQETTSYSYIRWAYLEEEFQEGELSKTADYNTWLTEYNNRDTKTFLHKIQRLNVGESYWSADAGMKIDNENAYAVVMKRTKDNGGTFIRMFANNQTTQSWASGVNNTHQFSWWYQNGTSDVEKMKLDNTGSLMSDYWKLNNSSTNPYLMFTQGSTWYIQGYQGYLYLGAGSAKSMRIDSSGNILSVGGITMYSDLRKKTILNHVELSLKEVADAPLIEHYYNSDESKRTHVGSVAQYWAGLNDWFCKEDGEGYLMMEIQNAALASAISVARELTRYESKTDKQIKKLKKRIGELEEEIENLKKV